MKRHCTAIWAGLAVLILVAATACSSGSLPVAGAPGSIASGNPSGVASSPGSSATPGSSAAPGSSVTPGGPNAGTEPSGSGSRSGVSGGTLFGGDVPLMPEQGKLGRTLAIVRDYYRLGQRPAFPDPSDQQAMAAGSTMLVSLVTQPGGATYASIAAGQEDAEFSTFLRSVEQAAVTHHLAAIYFSFEDEVDDAAHHIGLGTPAQFLAAWDHLHQLAASEHLNWNAGGRIHWVWILTALGYSSGVAAEYWPGPQDVDIVASDGYNTDGCRSTPQGTNMTGQGTKEVTPEDIFGPLLDFARTHGGLPVFIAEWASVNYTTPSIQPGFIKQMESFVLGNPQIAAALYWNSHGQQNGCDYSLDNLPNSLSALATMAHAPGLQGHI